ncbi:hypothetical protein CVT26_008573 [Gymnopilus dilepis]|uniref:DUF6589 domain-containing protein n=1 Tax=Gymnopilus dilepis TaxID=231916 RepID=A0A409XXR0_9AGAR|nr:hypothetical protein CVT26_008573 [Gymnopilus dilepis]
MAPKTPARPPKALQPTTTPGLPSATPSSSRKPARQDPEKLETILAAIADVDWTVPVFLEKFFSLEDQPSKQQRQITAMLNGTTKPYLGTVLEVIFQKAKATKFRADDESIDAGTNMLAPRQQEIRNIRHAYPAMVTWAARLTGDLVNEEAKDMIAKETGLHCRAGTKKLGGGEDDDGSQGKETDTLVSWETLASFSLKSLEAVAVKNAPILWSILNSYTNEGYQDQHVCAYDYGCQFLTVVKVVLNAVLALTFGRSNRASLYALGRAVWMFAAKAPHTLYRVESRLGMSVAYTTVYRALATMSQQKRRILRNAVASGKNFIVVSDNIQVYARERERRIGKENRMITGLAGTAILMEDYDPAAFDLQDLMQRQKEQGRKNLTTKVILDDINTTHLDNVATVQFLQALFAFVPQCSAYKDELKEFMKSHLAIKPIQPTRRSTIIPLATNSADEMTIQGIKEGILDFASTQMGINRDTLGNRASIWSGDGKTFNMLHLLKKLSSAEEHNFDAFRWVIPLLELWHTKWTDLSRTVRGHWGSTDDPASLATAAEETDFPTPTDMRKVDFYDGSHLVNLALDAHILNCWE